MWLSRQMIAGTRARPAAEVASVTGEATVQGALEYRDVRLAGPWGIAYRPPGAADAVLVESAAGTACVGTVVPEKGIEAGELLLYSAGGAQIYLKNNGEVLINGRSFAPGEG